MRSPFRSRRFVVALVVLASLVAVGVLVSYTGIRTIATDGLFLAPVCLTSPDGLAIEVQGGLGTGAIRLTRGTDTAVISPPDGKVWTDLTVSDDFTTAFQIEWQPRGQGYDYGLPG